MKTFRLYIENKQRKTISMRTLNSHTTLSNLTSSSDLSWSPVAKLQGGNDMPCAIVNFAGRYTQEHRKHKRIRGSEEII